MNRGWNDQVKKLKNLTKKSSRLQKNRGSLQKISVKYSRLLSDKAPTISPLMIYPRPLEPQPEVATG